MLTALLLSALAIALAGGVVGWALARRTAPEQQPLSPVDLRVEGWLACEQAVEREAPEILHLVRTSVPASLRLAYELYDERVRHERFMSAEWRRRRSRRERLLDALSRRAA